VPELSSLSDAEIHDPGILRPRDYPAPIIGHAEARQRALAALAEFASGVASLAIPGE
jgi:deoxyribodipyrimidine photo-lyase